MVMVNTGSSGNKLVYQARPSRKVRERLADVISIHSSVNLQPAPVLVLPTEAKVLLPAQNGTVESDRSASHAY